MRWKLGKEEVPSGVVNVGRRDKIGLNVREIHSKFVICELCLMLVFKESLRLVLPKSLLKFKTLHYNNIE